MFVDVVLVYRTYRTEHVCLFVPDFIGIEGHRRFHGDHAEDLKKVVLDHVPEAPV